MGAVLPPDAPSRLPGPSPETAAGRPLLIGSDIYRRSRYGRRHPLSIARVSPTIDLARALGWLPDDAYVESPQATVAQLTRFHDPDYVAALIEAERTQRADAELCRRHGIGCAGNPVFAEVFRRPATSVGASLAAVRLLAEGGIVHNPAGGTHHGRRDRASGFCFFNDPVLAILAFQDQGLDRILYVDLDAHHGDGVEDAFAADDRVFTISVHEAGRWPGTGLLTDRAGGMARNLPVPPGLHDDELAAIVEEAILPLGHAFRPQALVLQCGADGLEEDPQSRLALGNRALWRAVDVLRPLAPRVLVLGGGGYNPWSVARCWAGIWATVNGHPVPERLPPAAEAVLRDLEWNHSRGRNPPEHWFTTLADPHRGGPVRAEVRHAIAATLASDLPIG
ncbi:acetoin utilization protein AcuC [Allostella sp. ATCC 35155]|nr:acetoin utilization protein AcuC [Stella sp. ATCC 35155]